MENSLPSFYFEFDENDQSIDFHFASKTSAALTDRVVEELNNALSSKGDSHVWNREMQEFFYATVWSVLSDLKEKELLKLDEKENCWVYIHPELNIPLL